MDNITFAAFTSACGGSGCTSAAAAFAQISSKLMGRKVLFMSFDLFSSKMIPSAKDVKEAGRIPSGLTSGKGSSSLTLSFPLCRDSFGVGYISGGGLFNPLHSMSGRELNVFLENISHSDAFDLAVLDIPFRSPFAEALCLCCEKIVTVKGYLHGSDAADEALFGYLKNVSGKMYEMPEVYMFSPSRDDESFEEAEADIHGQFGGEVRQLAEELLAPGR